MKIVIDEKVCAKHKLTLKEVLLVLAIRDSDTLSSTLDNMVKRGILKRVENDYCVETQCSDVVDEIILESSGGIDNEERLTNLAQKVREAFPKGKQYPGSPYYFRCNNREVMMQLKRFFNVYGNFPDDDIVNAAKRYVASFNGNYDKMRLAKYFIMKDIINPATNNVERVSELASFLENKEERAYVEDGTWMISSRN